MVSLESNPSLDHRSDYDYSSGEIVNPEFVEEIKDRIDGDVRFDEYSRHLYSTDASVYKVIPIGVVFPSSKNDVGKVVEYCFKMSIPVLPRGAGTSLAGQAVNKAVVLDFTRYMDDLISIDKASRKMKVQPGAILDEINNELENYNLKFAPDPAWSDKSTIGGALGNNSTGSHSLKYGKTDAYIEECEAVLSDGSITRFKEIELDELKKKAVNGKDIESQIHQQIFDILDKKEEKIKNSYPNIKRNVSGYNIDKLVEDKQEGKINIAKLLGGSEGTLAVVTELTISLEPIPKTKSMVMLAYRDLLDALNDVKNVLYHDPVAVEILDDVLLDLAYDTEEFSDLVDSMVPEEAKSVLLVEFYAENDEQSKKKVARLVKDRVEKNNEKSNETGRAFDYIEAYTEAERNNLWKLRKSGLPILLSRTTDEKHISFIEDCAVPPENLADFVSEFQEILDNNETYASFYGHAGPGVLHIRPLINTKTIDGIEKMKNISKNVTDLVIKYNGSISGEHGDGRARTQWNKKLYGEDVLKIFRTLKESFDPDEILNPGQIYGEMDLTENLRFDLEYEFNQGFQSNLVWQNQNGLQGMVELCHGCGGCRGLQKTNGGVMCPTYRASREEITSTRGRANLLRQAMSGDLSEDVTSHEFMNEVMDLCIGCKGCARDCPSEVDMAKLKAEIEYEHHQKYGSSIRDRLFANIDKLCYLGSFLYPISNLAQSIPKSELVLEKLLGIARESEIPKFKRQSFEDWFEKRKNKVSKDDAEDFVLFFPDTYTNYIYTNTAKSAVQLLESADIYIEIPDIGPSGRAAYSKGFLDKARSRAKNNMEVVLSKIKDGWNLVTVEPSDAVMFQLDYSNLLSTNDVRYISKSTYGICEYIDINNFSFSFREIDEHLIYHGHCHQKAMKKDHHAVSILQDAGYKVDNLDSGCCGMAGSFGYEAEHYSMSKSIGKILFDQIQESNGEKIVAPGASCRSQLKNLGEKDNYPPHPIEKFENALM